MSFCIVVYFNMGLYNYMDFIVLFSSVPAPTFSFPADRLEPIQSRPFDRTVYKTCPGDWVGSNRQSVTVVLHMTCFSVFLLGFNNQPLLTGQYFYFPPTLYSLLLYLLSKLINSLFAKTTFFRSYGRKVLSMLVNKLLFSGGARVLKMKLLNLHDFKSVIHRYVDYVPI